MDDLISRKAAIEALGERPYNWTDGEAEIAEVCAWESHKSAIENIPAVNAVPVVRCRDCRHWHEDIGATTKWLMCHEIVTDRNWFCADGERRESE